MPKKRKPIFDFSLSFTDLVSGSMGIMAILFVIMTPLIGTNGINGELSGGEKVFVFLNIKIKGNHTDILTGHSSLLHKSSYLIENDTISQISLIGELSKIDTIDFQIKELDSRFDLELKSNFNRLNMDTSLSYSCGSFTLVLSDEMASTFCTSN